MKTESGPAVPLRRASSRAGGVQGGDSPVAGGTLGCSALSPQRLGARGWGHAGVTLSPARGHPLSRGGTVFLGC